MVCPKQRWTYPLFHFSIGVCYGQQFRYKKIILIYSLLQYFGKNIFQAIFVENLRQKARQAGGVGSYSL
jgi:hypothetical protein